MLFSTEMEEATSRSILRMITVTDLLKHDNIKNALRLVDLITIDSFAVEAEPASEPTPLFDVHAHMRQLVAESTLAVINEEPSDGRHVQASTSQSSNTVRFSIWDMAGQPVFYDLLHMLLTRCGVYLVCFNMKDFVRTEEAAAVSLAYIKHWLTSIHLHASGAPVLLVGTHKDKVADRKKHECISQSLYTALTGHPTLLPLTPAHETQTSTTDCGPKQKGTPPLPTLYPPCST